jgi:hypothetical protein
MRLPRMRGSFQPRRSFACFLVALTALAALLTARDSGVAASGQTQKIAPTATVTPHPTVLPAPTVGWAIATDTRFQFQAPIPPGWKAEAYTAYASPQGGDGACVIGFFPPDLYPDAPAATPSEYPFGTTHEYMDIHLPLCSPGEEATPNRPAAEPGGILIGATHAPYYVYDIAEWIQRVTRAKFGGQTYPFIFDTMPQDKGLRDLPLFHGALAGFKYLG